MSIGDNNTINVYRLSSNADGHLTYGADPIFSSVSCSILRISPDRQAQMDLGDKILAYDMHVGHALDMKIGDRVFDVAGTKYEVYAVDVIRDIDTFTRAILKREYTDAEGF
jgi:hypothetical protein